MKERTKSTIAVIIVGAILLLAGYVEVNAGTKTDYRDKEVCYTDCVGDVCHTTCIRY